MVRTWVDMANERHSAINDARPRGAAWLPDSPGRHRSPVGRAQSLIRLALGVTIFGTVIPSDLYLANGFWGSPIHALRDPMVINSLINISVVFAVPVIPLGLLAILLHIRHGLRGHRQDSVG